MEAQLAVAGLITVAVITPGPNNFIVLEQALRGGLRAAVPAIAGVVTGTQLLLLLIGLGVGVLFAQEPRLRVILTFGGAGYLFWLGLQVIWRSFSREEQEKDPQRAIFASFSGLVLFQFLNPKSWVLVLTATAALSGDLSGLAGLSLLFLVIPSLCLLLWAVMGMALTRLLADQKRRRWFDRVMGGLLLVSAGMLFL